MLRRTQNLESKAARTLGRSVGALGLTASVVVGMLLLGVSPASAATTQLAVDGLDRTVASGLASAPVGGAWTSYGASILSVGAGAAKVTGLAAGTSVGGYLPPTSVNTDVQSTLARPDIGATTATTLTYAVEARRQADASAYRGRVKVSPTGALALSFTRTNATGAETILGTKALPLVLAKNQILRMELQVTGTSPVQLQSRAWIDGTTAPAWQYTLTDADAAKIAGAGKVGFWAWAATSGSASTFTIPGFRADSMDTTVTNPPTGTKPSAANTGVPAGTVLTDYTGPATITVDGTVIDSKSVNVDLRIQAKNVIIRNSYLHCGTGLTSGNSGCIDANSAANFNLLVENNTIIPDHPTYYRDGIVGHEFTARGNEIAHSNDGLGIFNRPGGSVQANVTATGNYIHDLTRWNTDPAHTDGTHNDGIEVQGGENILIQGNTIIGSVVAGDGLGVFGNHAGSAIIVVQNVAKNANLVINDNWLDDAQNSVCINNGKYTNVTLTMQGNKFGRNQYDFGNNSTYQIRVYSKSKSTITGLANNTWEDTGALLTEGRNTGIRYNAA